MLTPIQIERGREFLKDLRANPLKAKGEMRKPDGRRCCLCVALDSAISQGFECPEPGSEQWQDDSGYPPNSMANFYGWPIRNPILDGHHAECWNDGVDGATELTHPQIADLFELEYPELKLPEP